MHGIDVDAPNPNLGFETEDTEFSLGSGTDRSAINILIVDDEPRNLTVLETILVDPSYRLVRAGSADEALLALLREDFALLILDIQMPGVSGFELAQMIKKRKKSSHVPIIFITAYYNEDQHVLEGYVSGAVDYLHKPINPAVLRSKVAIFVELYCKSREVEVVNLALRGEIVERMRAEDELRLLNATLEQRIRDRTRELMESERQYRGMIDALPTAVYTTDAKGFITHFNPAAQELAGRTPALGADQWCVSSKLYHPDGNPLALDDAPMVRVLQTGRALREAELVVEQPNGKRIPVITYPTPTMDAAGTVIGGINVLIDVTERKRADDQIRLLMREVNHRSKNMLAVVTAIARQTITNNSVDFMRTFSERVNALAASHDLLVKNEWRGIKIEDLVRAQLAHFEDLIDRRIVLDGPSARATVTAAQGIGMVVHELATNAAKHGALSAEGGCIDIRWKIESCNQDNRFSMEWIEREGPPVSEPKRRGFGSTVVKSMIELSLGGDVELDYAPSGLRWRLNCPAAIALEEA